MAIQEINARLAVRNVARYGDTDVFPYPIENHWFHDAEDDVVALLMVLDSEFDTFIATNPVHYATCLSSVGYNGFRAATQIDPLWNLYLLGLLIEIGDDIENARVPVHRDIVFSYRLKISRADDTLFDKSIGWAAFHRAALERASGFEFVVTSDISDFYPRVYHHRLENALKQATNKSEVVRRIMTVLTRLSNGPSYGLPVGGQAARLLAELLLNRTDRLLIAANLKFCRFVDDYIVFAANSEMAQSALVNLSEILLTNEGLTLARSKTRTLSRSEFAKSSPMAGPTDPVSQDEMMSKEFLGFRLAFDPYSPTADLDYEALKEQLRKYDITGMLARELRKSRIDESMTRQLVKSTRYLDPDLRDKAVLSIVQNLGLLYPIFPTVAILLRQLLADLSMDTRNRIFETMRDLIVNNSHILLVPANLSFAIRILAFDRAEETDALLMDVYQRPKTNMLVKRDVLLAMARRRVDYWLSERLRTFAVVTAWEKRALIVASYTLGDEGKHWRDRIRGELNETDRRFMKWAGTKNDGREWEVPL